MSQSTRSGWRLLKPGDQLIELGTDTAAKPLRPGDLALHDLVLAWALDQSRLNMLLLMKLDPNAVP